MRRYADKLDFEKAAELRNHIAELKALQIIIGED